MTPETTKEFQRIRADFERYASEYFGLKLSIVMTSPDRLKGRAFGQPNHAVMLWQYLGRMTKVDHPLVPTAFGMPAAEFTAFGVIEGEQTDLFKRIATRAGTILPQAPLDAQLADLQLAFDDPDAPGKPVFVANRDPVARWIGFILASTWSHEPSRLRGRDFLVDPFAASLSALDHLLAAPEAKKAVAKAPDAPETPDGPFSARRFAVALSFPGKKRPYVKTVADFLQEKVPTFYDNYFEAELARPNLDIILQDIYSNRSELVVVFLCKEYVEKEWCGLEWRAIRNILKERNDHRLMFMRFDDATVPGVFPIDGYIDLRLKSESEAAELIIKRLRDVRASGLTGAGSASTPKVE